MITDLSSDIPNTLRKGIAQKNRDSKRLLHFFNIRMGAHDVLRYFLKAYYQRRHITSILPERILCMGRPRKTLCIILVHVRKHKHHASYCFKREPIVIR